jgi:hypothetical protein
MGTAGYPDSGLVLFCFKLTVGIYLEEFRMQRSLKKAESELVDRYIHLWQFHDENPQKAPFSVLLYYIKIGSLIQA